MWKGVTRDEKVLPVPDFHPQIAKLKLADGVASVEQIITLTGRDGAPLVGLIDPQAITGEALVDLNGKPLAPSDHGLDGEGLVAMPDGTFWVSDEYGPFIVHFDANGKELERLSPFDGPLPKELSLRSPNQGMEGLTLTPDGSTLVGMMQSGAADAGPGRLGQVRPDDPHRDRQPRQPRRCARISVSACRSAADEGIGVGDHGAEQHDLPDRRA